VTRSATALVAVALAAAVLAVQAGASDPGSVPTPAGTALAKAIVLKARDVPAGWKAAPGGSGGGSLTCKKFDPDQSDLTATGRADRSFQSGDGLFYVISRATVFKNARQAQSSWSRLARPGLLACLASTLEGLANGSTTVKVVSRGSLAAASAAQRHAAYRVVADVTVGGQTLQAYLDAILQGSGSANVVVLVSSVGQLPAKALESKLAAAVAGRLRR
jgi:hypothetical protein